MSAYFKKPVVVYAKQWHKGVEILGVRKVPANRVNIPERGIKVDRPERYVVITPWGEATLSDGDWVVTDITGDLYAYKPDTFHRLFESEASEFSLLSVIADIRAKSGVGDVPMLSELADAIAQKINDK